MTVASTSEQRHREQVLTANFERYAHEEFPDNTQNTWEVLGFEHRDQGITIAEARPTPDDVGYPSFKFMFRFDGQSDTVQCVATYCFEDGGYSLLSSHRKWTKKVPREL